MEPVPNIVSAVPIDEKNNESVEGSPVSVCQVVVQLYICLARVAGVVCHQTVTKQVLFPEMSQEIL